MIDSFDKSIFIIGSGRSGTSLIQAILNAHSKISSPPEFHFFKHYIANPLRQHLNQIENIEHLESFLLRDKKIQRLDIDVQQVLQPYKSGKSPFDFASVYKSYMSNYLQRMQKKCFADGTPENIFYLTYISSIFPEAYIIHTLRDPRDVVLSMKKAGYNQGEDISAEKLATLIHKGYMQVQKCKHLFKNRLIVIKYEDLIDQIDEMVQRLCSFLDIEFEQEMIHFNKSASQVFSREESQWKSNLTKPIMKGNYGKWKQQLSAKDVLITENICNNLFTNGLYKKSEYSANASVLDKMNCSFRIFRNRLLNTRLLKKKDLRYND